MILTPQQRSAFTRAQAAANAARPRVEYLEALARVSPQLNDRVHELRVRLDYLTQLSEIALNVDRQLQ